MGKFRNVTLFALLFCLFSAGTASAVVGSSPISAEIVSSLAITNTASLNFGQIASGTSAGTVTMTPLGIRLPIGVVLGNQGTSSAASFTVTGGPLNLYSIVLPADGTVTLTSGSHPAMAVNTFLSVPALLGTLSLTGSQTLLVGATLSVGANQPNGIYTGTFNVTVSYN